MDNYEELVRKIMAERDHVSFVELADYAERHGLEASGEYAIDNDSLRALNVIAWGGLSEGLAGAVSKCAREGVFHFEPCEVLVYLIDGGVPNLPIMRTVRKRRYKELHWVPVVMKRGRT